MRDLDDFSMCNIDSHVCIGYPISSNIQDYDLRKQFVEGAPGGRRINQVSFFSNDFIPGELLCESLYQPSN